MVDFVFEESSSRPMWTESALLQEDEAKKKENIGGEIQTGKSQKVPRNKNKRRKKIVFGKIQDGGLEIRPLVGGWREVEALQDLLDLLDLLQERWWKRGKTEEEWRITTSGRRCWIQYHKSGGDTSTHSIS